MLSFRHKRLWLSCQRVSSSGFSFGSVGCYGLFRNCYLCCLLRQSALSQSPPEESPIGSTTFCYLSHVIRSLEQNTTIAY